MVHVMRIGFCELQLTSFEMSPSTGVWYGRIRILQAYLFVGSAAVNVGQNPMRPALGFDQGYGVTDWDKNI